MNWGKSIVLAFVLFALLMMYFLFKTIISGSEKVPDNYYEKGNAFQNVLDEEKGVEKFKTKLFYEAKSRAVFAMFDSIQPDSGSMTLQWPPDASKQLITRLSQRENTDHVKTFFAIPVSGPKGSWLVQLRFYKAGKAYYLKQKVWVE